MASTRMILTLLILIMWFTTQFLPKIVIIGTHPEKSWQFHSTPGTQCSPLNRHHFVDHAPQLQTEIGGDDRAVMRRKPSRNVAQLGFLKCLSHSPLLKYPQSWFQAGFLPRKMTNLTRHRLENCAEVHETVFFRNEKLGGGNSTICFIFTLTLR